jgi:hypothetical protein
LKHAGQKTRPGKILVYLKPELGEGLGDVYSELMRRGILAGIITPAAIVAEVGQVFQILLRESSAQLHSRVNRAESLTIAAGITDRHHSFGLIQQIC